MRPTFWWKMGGEGETDNKQIKTDEQEMENSGKGFDKNRTGEWEREWLDEVCGKGEL